MSLSAVCSERTDSFFQSNAFPELEEKHALVMKVLNDAEEVYRGVIDSGKRAIEKRVLHADKTETKFPGLQYMPFMLNSVLCVVVSVLCVVFLCYVLFCSVLYVAVSVLCVVVSVLCVVSSVLCVVFFCFCVAVSVLLLSSLCYVWKVNVFLVLCEILSRRQRHAAIPTHVTPALEQTFSLSLLWSFRKGAFWVEWWLN